MFIASVSEDMFLKKQLLQNYSIGEFSLGKRRGLVFLEKFQGGKVSNIENPEPPYKYIMN